MAFFLNLPQEQTVGSALGAGLGQGLQQGVQAGLTGSLDQYFDQKKKNAEFERKQSVVNKFLSSEEGKNQSPLVQSMLKLNAAGLVPDAAITAALKPEIFKQNLQAMGINLSDIAPGMIGTQQSGMPQQIGQGMPVGADEESLMRMMLIPEIQPYAEAKLKRLTEQRKESKEGKIPDSTKERLDKVFNRQLDIAEQGGLGIPYLGSISKLSPKKRELMSEFQTLGVSIEAALMPLVNKGTLAKPRFDYIMSNIPQADDTPETIRGKIKALSTELGVQIPRLEQEESKKTKPKITKKMKAPSGYVHMMNPETGESLFVPNKDIDAAKADNFSVIQ